MIDLKQNILENTNYGLDVFEFFIPELKKYGTKKNFRALFRDDGISPDANVMFSNGIWLYHDYVTGETLNPIDFVIKLKNSDFKEAIKFINQEIVLANNEPTKKRNIVSNTIKVFSINESDNYKYWASFCEESKIIDTLRLYGVSSLKSYSYHKNGRELRINATDENPIFSFRIAENCHKIYRPNAKDKKAKFMWLGAKPEKFNDLYGVEQLPEYSEFILIVEGLKDVIVVNANGIQAVGVDHAATRISKEDIEFLQSKCKHLLVCYDIDEPGIKASKKLAFQHGLKRLDLSSLLANAGGKDISDFFFLKLQAKEIRLLAENLLSSPQNTIDKNGNEQAIRLSKFEKVENLISDNFELRYNEVSNEIEYRPNNNLECEFNELNENNIYRFLQHNNIEFSMAKLTSLLRSDFVMRFNPFSNYFEQLPDWDDAADNDYINQLCGYLYVIDMERFQVQFKKALVRTVACAINDNIINKQAFILVHEEQNSGKTTFIRWLCPPKLKKYIAENISTDKDSLIALSDNFIINMDELATLSRAEINTLKSMFSKETIKVRRPYDKNATSVARRASFFGSTNKAEFLTDETGSVRWLCFELTGRINWDYMSEINIDDIWRQAYSLYHCGFKYELTPDEILENEKANQHYQVNTTELELIQKHFLPGNKELNDAFYQATDFVNYFNEKYLSPRLNIINMGKALKILGFERVSKRSEKYPVKGYFVTFLETNN